MTDEGAGATRSDTIERGAAHMKIRYRLGDADWAKINEANRLLAEVTARHHHACACELCRARALTDTQDDDSRTVTCEPVVEGWPGND